MSSTGDLVQALRRFINSLAQLLSTQTAREAPNIAAELGAQSQFKQAIDALRGVLGQLKAGLEKLRQPLVGADAVLAGFEMLNDGLVPFGRGQALADITLLLGLHDDPFKPVTEAVNKGHGVLDTALQLADQLPAPGDIKALGGELEKLDQSLANLLVAGQTPPTGNK